MNLDALKNATILMVDDQPTTLKLLFDYFGHYDINVLVAEDAQEAFAILKDTQPDIILLDIMMPGMNGFELCGALKEKEATKDIPVLFITALTDTRDKLKGFEVGGVDYITKPFQRQEVLARLNTHLQLRKNQLRLEEEALVRKRAQDALEHSEQMFRSVWEDSFDGMRVVNEKCEIVMVNKAFCRLALKKKEELVGRPLYVIYDERHHEQMTNEMKQRFERNLAQSRWVREITLWNNHTVWFEVSNSFLGAPTEKRRILSIFRNVTEAKNADKSLRESEERFRTIADFTYDWEYWMGPDGQLIWVSPSCKSLTGYSQEEFLEKPDLFRSIIDPADLDRCKDIVFNPQPSETPVNIEFRIIRRDDKVIWISHNSRAVFAANGRFLGARANNRDVTKRVITERNLQHSEERHRFLSEMISDYAYSFTRRDDGSFEIDWMTGAFERITGYQISEVYKGLTWRDLAHPDDVKIAEGRIGTMMQGNNDISEFRILTKDGEIKWIRDYGKPILHPDTNKLYRILGAAQDITEQKLTELKLKETAKELSDKQEKLEKQTARLSELNRQLQQSEEDLRVINAGKDRLFSIIAHDLRSPFTALLGYSEFLADDIDELEREEISQFGAHINETLQSLFNLINNLLEWSRIQSGRMEFNPDETKIAPLVDKVFGIYKVNASKKNIKLINEIDAAVQVFADAYMVDTVLRNLVSNAIKFTKTGGDVRVYSLLQPSMVLITVEDNGVGMEPEFANEVFNITTKTSRAGTEEEEGTGLGLILCDEFVRKNGGKIWVESDPGKGSRFNFTMPRQKPDDQ